MSTRALHFVRIIAVTIAVVFGLATIVAGGRVLLGSDPGYVVFRPLLIYNTVMGLVYVGAGLVMWNDLSRGRTASGFVATLNVLVLLGILLLYQRGGAVAIDSLRAMTLRTTIWFALFAVTAWLLHATRAPRAAV